MNSTTRILTITKSNSLPRFLSSHCKAFNDVPNRSIGGKTNDLVLLLPIQQAAPGFQTFRKKTNCENITKCQSRNLSTSNESTIDQIKSKSRCDSSDGDYWSTPSEAGKGAHRLRSDQDRNLLPSVGIGMDTLLSHAGLTGWKKGNHPHDGAKDGQDDTTNHHLSLYSLNEPLCPPLHLETTYTRPPSGDYFNPKEGGQGWIYSRIGNPTRKLLEDCMSRLELISHGAKAIEDATMSWSEDDVSGITCAFSSGMAAVAAILLALPQPLHILLPNDIYHGVPTQLKTMFVQRNVTYSTIDMTKIEKVQFAIQQFLKRSDDENVHDNRPHLLVWMESPSNPQCKVVDIKTVCQYVSKCREDSENSRITTVVDSTWAPPPITQPLLLGADVVMHSGTKYLGGHSDVLLGIVTVSPFTNQGKALTPSIRAIQTTLGSTASPFDCWLTLRGLRTLHLRIERQSKTALQLASYLASHELVERVHYPGLVIHPQHEVASRQMQGGCYGGMLSFEMKSEAMAMAVAGAVSTIQRGTSLGGTETLIEHRASIEPDNGRVSPEGLLRVSVGLEDFQDLKEDLRRAILVAQKVMTMKSG
mmetsp:Transcript_5166/g.9825  ORF Transcript_5166/g.9825 Transcript_5166/m.9825 type:complete len:588 (+) Transcript_5166:563-2326(+)